MQRGKRTVNILTSSGVAVTKVCWVNGSKLAGITVATTTECCFDCAKVGCERGALGVVTKDIGLPLVLFAF